MLACPEILYRKWFSLYVFFVNLDLEYFEKQNEWLCQMLNSLNDTQLEILKLFSHEQSEEDLQEIKSLLVAYLSDKVVREADKAFDERNYTHEVFDKWKREHFRKQG